MSKLKIKIDPRVRVVFEKYPVNIKSRLEQLRQLIIGTAEEMEQITVLEETLKWGEPSYLVRHGSTIRIDWKVKNPAVYSMYFKCTSQLVPTFKEVYGELFEYEKNRAIVFDKDAALPVEELKECIKMALQYHKLKHLPRLGQSV